MKSLNQFTNLYPLSKTLRFELKPTENTREKFDQWLKEEKEETEKEDNFYLKDKKIAAAYLALKPVLDKLHEFYIEAALTSEEAKKIDFEQYLNAYRNKDVNADLEKSLRASIGKTFSEAEKIFKLRYKELGITPKKNILQDKEVLNFIQKTACEYAPSDSNQKEFKEEITRHLKAFKGFHTYLSGYNINRNNYYETDTEKSTAVATRIVHENLPKFCDNIIRFESRKEEYLEILNWLNENGRITEIKNAIKGRFEEVESIKEEFFYISHFNYCLSQSQIEEYNRIIGNYNLLVNLYNQARKNLDRSFRRLEEFSILFKQIGCSKGKISFQPLIKDLTSELSEPDKERCRQGELLTVESVLEHLKEGCDKYFTDSSEELTTIPSFVHFLTNCQDWKGIYWSKTAVNIISKNYFTNWHAIKDKLKDKKACATYDPKREEPVQLRDAIELSDLFAVLDEEKSEFLFKPRLIEEGLVLSEKSPSDNIIRLICNDINKKAKDFVTKSDGDKEKRQKINKKANDFVTKSDDVIKQWRNKDKDKDKHVLTVKDWLDLAIDTLRIVRYFSVRASKMKGNTPNPLMEKMLSHLLHNDEYDWFGCYDLVRNFLTKKPQDDIKEGKLKLNFNTPALLQGWSDGQEKVKGATILRRDQDTYLCLLKKKSIFSTSTKENKIYLKKSTASRLILKNLKFQTLAGKGFVGEFKEKYSEMGIRDSQKAIDCLKKIIRDRYVTKYPNLNRLLENKYKDKELFDADIKKALEDCYTCEFAPIDWDLVKANEKKGDLFLFKIHCKDYQKKATGKKDLQTIYWENVLMEDSAHQLCAGAEIFMREPLKGMPISHKLGEKLVNKKDALGNTIPNTVYRDLLLFFNGKLENEPSAIVKEYIEKGLVIVKDVKQEIQKDKRFFDRKFLFHCPIKLNYRADNSRNADKKLKEIIQRIPNPNFIGIDRGEKHLVYSCIIDQNANILRCQHYDNINGTNYVQKLEERANEKMEQRKNWKQQDDIKNLKDGYISHVVHHLTECAIKDENGEINPHAYIVLEDLNTEMKRGRQKVEKQVYQKLETALAKKLNFVVDKNIPNGMPGSVSHALQLTPPLNNYSDIEEKKQFGIMLYTRANYTSVTDPATGWRQTIYLKDGNEEEIKRQIMETFSDFGFDGTDYYFEYTENNVGKKWRLYSGINGESLPRFRNDIQKEEDFNRWVPKPIEVVPILNELFKNFDKSKSFKSQIENGVSLNKLEEKKTAWQTLRFAIGVIQQIRNSGILPKDDNFLFSPVRNENGEHFDTRNAATNGPLSAIVDADANGAYNIARKGLIMDAHIKYCKEESDTNLLITDKEWDMWLLDRKKWEENLPDFARKANKATNPRSTKKIKGNSRKP